jgi:hypothetical protein
MFAKLARALALAVFLPFVIASYAAAKPVVHATDTK